MTAMTQASESDGKAGPIFHWLPSSVLGGLEVAALTVIQATPSLRHVVVAGDATGPSVALWREAGAEVRIFDPYVKSNGDLAGLVDSAETAAIYSLLALLSTEMPLAVGGLGGVAGQ
jgi:hypothetical protein